MNDLDLIKLNGCWFINDQRLFMSIKSTDGHIGVDHYGNLIEINNNIRKVLLSGIATGCKNNDNDINSIKPIFRTLDDKLELEKYPLTYAIGHPFYKPNNTEYLIGNSWKEYINLKISSKELNIVDLTNSNNKILLIQGKDSKYVITKESFKSDNYICNLSGIVIRHSAILLIDDFDLTIKTEFILIESGGLLQAGSNINNYRFTSKLKIILTNDKYGYRRAGEVTSQYSYIVYNPGITLYKEAFNYIKNLGKNFCLKTTKLKDLKNEEIFINDILKYYYNDDNIILADLQEIILQKSQSCYIGNPYNMCCNSFGSKCIAVGFNGNYQLNGLINSDEIYNGTWNIYNDDETKYLDETNLMSYMDNIINSNISNIEINYPLLWCQLSNKIFKKGDLSIIIDSKYCNNNFEYWKEGMEIVITCKTKKYTSEKDWIGMIPIYLNSNNKINRDANIKANNKYILEKYLRRTHNTIIDTNIDIPDEEEDFENTGVEVARIKKLIYNNNNKFTGEIILEEPLKFNHNSKKSILENFNNKKIIVDTNIHVALLTRNILITSEFNNEDLGSGANRDIWKLNIDCACCYNSNKINNNYKESWFGSYGSIYSNYLNFIDDKNNTNLSNAAYIFPRNRDINKNVCRCNFCECYLICNCECCINNCCDKSNIICNNNTSEDIDKYYSGKEKPPVIYKGHWIFDTEHIKGCNSIYGGHQMFMYGSSVRLDGVEIKYLGTPANFGTIGRYPIHFHLAGFTKLYKEYLPNIYSDDKIYCRSSDILNCSIWCSFNRWVNIHGTHEINVKNNIGFISYGSGYFIEDGTEQNNTFEHNMAICCLSASKHEYWNPLPIFPNVTSDLAICSAFWFKNNQNRCFRNVICNSPAPVIAIWYVPQNISRLRGHSTICIGDEILRLSCLGTSFNALGNENEQIGLNTYNKNNINGYFYKFTTNTVGWIPEYFEKKFYTDINKCITFTGKNSDNPYKLSCENIVYCMFGGMSEFPEILGIPVGDYYGRGLGGTSNSENIGIKLYQLEYLDNNKVRLIKNNIVKGIPQFLPYNGLSACVDDWKTQETYFSTRWGGSGNYRFQPISNNILNIIDNNLYLDTNNNKSITIAGETKSNTIPKIFSNWLIFNCAPNQGSLWGGAGWIKSSPGWLINCCLLCDGGGEFVTNPNPNYNDISSNNYTAGYYDYKLSSVWSMTCGDAINYYPHTYFIIHNLISNGGIGLPPNPTIISGNKTFFSKTSKIMNIEYNNLNASVNNYFFIDTNPFELVPISYWIDTYNTRNKSFSIFIKNNNNWEHYLIDKLQSVIPIINNTSNNIRKYPYIINNNSLFLISDSHSESNEINKWNPEWYNIVINSHLECFINDYSLKLGNYISNNIISLPIKQFI